MASEALYIVRLVKNEDNPLKSVLYKPLCLLPDGQVKYLKNPPSYQRRHMARIPLAGFKQALDKNKTRSGTPKRNTRGEFILYQKSCFGEIDLEDVYQYKTDQNGKLLYLDDKDNTYKPIFDESGHLNFKPKPKGLYVLQKRMNPETQLYCYRPIRLLPSRKTYYNAKIKLKYTAINHTFLNEIKEKLALKHRVESNQPDQKGVFYALCKSNNDKFDIEQPYFYYIDENSNIQYSDTSDGQYQPLFHQDGSVNFIATVPKNYSLDSEQNSSKTRKPKKL